MSTTPVFGVLHVADLYRDRAMWEPSRNDWRRAGRFLRGEWPRAVPPRRIDTGGSAHELGAFWTSLDERVDFLTIDGEWHKDLTLSHLAIAAWEKDGQYHSGWQGEFTWGVPHAFAGIFRLLAYRYPCVFWNAMADVPVIRQNGGPDWEDYLLIEDPMQAHGVLWSELSHEYGFVASLYGEYPKLKHLRQSDPLLYNWGDVLDLGPIWLALQRELAADPGSTHIYRHTVMPLLPEIARARERGIAVNVEAVEPMLDAYGGRIERAGRYAEAYTGLPLNLGSTGVKGQLARYLNEVEGFTFSSIGKDEIAEERAKFLPVEPQREDREYSDELLQERLDLGAHPLLELRAQYAKDRQIKSHYLDTLVMEG